jgi:hypothetical protein
VPALPRLRALLLLTFALVAGAATTGSASAADVAGTIPGSSAPDPMALGPYGVNRANYEDGGIKIIIPSSTTGLSVRGETGGLAGDGTFTMPLNGNMTWPKGAPGPYKVIVFMHGRHSNCYSSGADGTSFASSAEDCPDGQRYPSWEGYDYISNVLASWGYATLSINVGNIASFDNLTGAVDAGAVARAQTMSASLDMLKEWGENITPPASIGDALVGKLDFSSIGIMGHSRGGEGVTQFIVYNRQRPAPGERYNLTSVFSLAPIDRNKHYPQGTNFATLLPACDGDVSTISGANAFERSRYTNLTDPFVKVQYYVEGADHNFFNTRWRSDDRTGTDISCGLTHPPLTPGGRSRGIRLNAEDQQRVGIAEIATFLRVYSGGETQLKPWTTGEAGFPTSACPIPGSFTVDCRDEVKQSYIAPAGERQDIIRPDSDVKPTTASPTAPDNAGGTYTATGMSLFEWCNPDPFSFGPSPSAPITACQGVNSPQGTAPNAFQRSYGPQLSLAWDAPARIDATLRGEARDASKFRTLSLRAAFQPTDVARNGLGDGIDPRSAMQDLSVALTDRDGNTKAVKLTDISRGIETTLGTPTATGQPRHTVLNGFRIPLSLYSDTVNVGDLEKVSLLFGEPGTPTTGAIQLSSVAFQELATPAAVDSAPQQVPLTPLPGDPKLDVVEPIVLKATAPAAKGCADTKAPVVGIGSVLAKGRLALKGTARDAAACGKKANAIKQVSVTVAKLEGKSCRFLLAKGSLSKRGSCSVALSLVAKGGSTWSLGTLKKLKAIGKGTYRVTVTAVDGAGNVSKAATRQLKVT